jgi:hypothetical protein
MRQDMTMRSAVCAFLLLIPGMARAQTSADTAGIRGAALDYIEGYWTANGERMAQAVHPALIKRIMNTDTAGNHWIREMSASELIRGTRMGGGSRTPAAQQGRDVRILDIFQNTASVRVDATGWIDYMHMVKWQGRWVIVNVLWETRR